MRQFLSCALVIAGLASSQVYGAVFDKFDCRFGIKDSLSGVESSQNSSLDSFRKEIQKPEGWSERVRLFSGGTFINGSLKNTTGTAVGVYNMQYFVAQQYDEAGQLLAAKVSPSLNLMGTFCEAGKPCLAPGPSVVMPLHDPFLHPSPEWKDMAISGGLAVLNAEDFWLTYKPYVDPNGKFYFVLMGGCSFRASIKTAPGE
jgi:hypothetical protein